MSYITQKRGPSPAGLASAVIVQVAIGAVVITGLSVASGAIETREIVDTFDIKDTPPPEPEPLPEPEPQTEPQPQAATEPPVTVPQPPIELPRPQPDYRTTEKIIERPVVPRPLPTADRVPTPPPPAPVPSFDPVSAKPRNNPGTWLRDTDYKSAWARRELQGVAAFTLDIAATGKVTGCRVTGSTGHGELDAATCDLLQRRAKFEPARGANGEAVAGQFSSSVRWVLPE